MDRIGGGHRRHSLADRQGHGARRTATLISCMSVRAAAVARWCWRLHACARAAKASPARGSSASSTAGPWSANSQARARLPWLASHDQVRARRGAVGGGGHERQHPAGTAGSWGPSSSCRRCGAGVAQRPRRAPPSLAGCATAGAGRRRAGSSSSGLVPSRSPKPYTARVNIKALIPSNQDERAHN